MLLSVPVCLMLSFRSASSRPAAPGGAIEPRSPAAQTHRLKHGASRSDNTEKSRHSPLVGFYVYTRF